MVQRSCLVILLIGVIAFASGASAQNCSCQNCTCQPGTCQHCSCQHQQQPGGAQQCTCTQNPVQAAGCIAPQNLPLVYEREAERAAAAAKIIEEFPQQQFLDDAKAIAVFPHLRKLAFIW